MKINEISKSEIDAVNKVELEFAIKKSDQKINNVMRFINANPSYDVKELANIFNLDWSLLRDFGNGVSKVGFYTDESQRFTVMELHLQTSKWFR